MEIRKHGQARPGWGVVVLGARLPGGDQGPGLSMSSLCVGGHSTTSPEFTDAHENGVQGKQGGHLMAILPGPQLWKLN